MEYCKNNNIELNERDIFRDKQSGKDFNRDGYQTMKKMLRKGDTVFVKELDRLGRNKEQIKQELEDFKKNGITIRILNIPTTLMDLPEEQNWVMDMINNILIEVMSAIAEEERNKIKTRQIEGIKSAKLVGKHLGRPQCKMPEDFPNYYKDWKDGKITAVICRKEIEMDNKKMYFFKTRLSSRFRSEIGTKVGIVFAKNKNEAESIAWLLFHSNRTDKFYVWEIKDNNSLGYSYNVYDKNINE